MGKRKEKAALEAQGRRVQRLELGYSDKPMFTLDREVRVSIRVVDVETSALLELQECGMKWAQAKKTLKTVDLWRFVED